MGDMSIADAMALAKNDDGLFSGTGAWVFFLFFLLAWGNGGFFGNNGTATATAATQGALTRAELTDGFNSQNVISKLDGITNGIADLGYAELGNFNTINTNMNANFNNLLANMNAGFNTVNNGITSVGYQVDSGFCGVNRNIDSVKYENQANTASIVQAVNDMGQRIIDRMTADTIDNLRTELQSAQMQISNNVQTANIIGALRPFPQPAYITCSPYQSSTTCPYSA